jgi:hypothetical protein
MTMSAWQQRSPKSGDHRRVSGDAVVLTLKQTKIGPNTWPLLNS